jgi:heptosyltransferase-2
MIPALRAGNHRLCVFLQNAFESALTAALARIPVRAGYPTDLRGPLLTHRIPFPAGVFEAHQVFYYLGITDYLSARYDGAHPRTTEPDCTAVIPEEYLLRARRLLSREGCDGDRFMCFCPGSVNSEAKRWPAESFARLAESVAENLGLAAVFLGAPGERALINGIQAQMRTRAANLAGHADIPTSMAVMRLSALTVSNDTGSAHLAAAAGAKVLTIFGPTKAGITAPWGKNVRLIQGQAPCAPCRHFTCPKPIHECMVSITPEAVLSECARMPAHE